ncbi:MAG: RNA polymerase sigma-70 factor, partial [Saprospiraceae bacterium]
MNSNQFKELFALYYNPLCNFAYSIILDEMVVKDIVQDVFLNVWKHKDTLVVKKNVKSYLYTSTKNRALEEIRKNISIKKKLETLGKLSLIENEQALLEKEWADWVKIGQIYSSLRHLPPKCREVFELSKINGLTYSQIAEKLNISPKTVENQMS